MNRLQPPLMNSELYGLIFSIENLVREFIIFKLSGIEGPHWHKRRIPGPILQKYKEGKQYERQIKWNQLVPHHPIYYIDFPHLKAIIEQKNNWDDAFSSVFGRRDILVSKLSEMEPIRNRIAHNRACSLYDLEVVRSIIEYLENCISQDMSFVVPESCAIARDIKTTISDLLSEIATVDELCTCYRNIHSTPVWDLVSKEWWFDTEYLDASISGIEAYFDFIEVYQKLPRGRGSGHRLEKLMTESDYQNLKAKAVLEAESLVK